MAINLQKGQRISLKKEVPQLTKLMCGLGWDIVQSKKGFLGIFGGSPDFDLDASVLCLNANNKLNYDGDVVYFGNLNHSSKAITHLGDNLTGKGEGDDEQIIVTLPQVPTHIKKLLFTVTIFDPVQRKQDFAQIKNAFVRLVDLGTNKEIARYTLSGHEYQGCTGLILAEVYQEEDGWKVLARGEGIQVNSLRDITQQYR
ncbi:MAG: TerD family protein [Microcystaceae cyanobacterium]